MKVSSPFKTAVTNHLQGLADKDPLFAETYKKPAKRLINELKIETMTAKDCNARLKEVQSAI